MAYTKTCFLEHTAVKVKDIQWHIRFFEQVLGMPVSRSQGPADSPIQVWTVGGMQLVSAPSFEGPEGRLVHLGIRCEDLAAVLEEAYGKWGVSELPQGHNWIKLPDGMEIELMQIEK